MAIGRPGPRTRLVPSGWRRTSSLSRASTVIAPPGAVAVAQARGSGVLTGGRVGGEYGRFGAFVLVPPVAVGEGGHSTASGVAARSTGRTRSAAITSAQTATPPRSRPGRVALTI